MLLWAYHICGHQWSHICCTWWGSYLLNFYSLRGSHLATYPYVKYPQTQQWKGTVNTFSSKYHRLKFRRKKKWGLTQLTNWTRIDLFQILTIYRTGWSFWMKKTTGGWWSRWPIVNRQIYSQEFATTNSKAYRNLRPKHDVFVLGLHVLKAKFWTWEVGWGTGDGNLKFNKKPGHQCQFQTKIIKESTAALFVKLPEKQNFTFVRPKT